MFQRVVSVELGVPGQAARRIERLHVSFSVDHTDASEPSQAQISIFNAAPDTIAAITQDGAVVRLFAGYADVGERLIFEGSPIEDGVRVVKAGVDRVLTIEAQDGGRDYRNAVVQVSFSGSVSVGEVVRAAIGSLGLPIGRVETSGDYPAGLVYSGASAGLLDACARKASARWFVRSGAVFFVPDDAETGELAVVLSSSAGNLIGSPTRTGGGIEALSLLDAQLQQGRAVRIESATITGDFRVTEVRHVGDSGFDTPFYSEIKAVPL